MQDKWWSVLFGAVLGACFLSLVISPFVGWWLPRNVASFGGDIDHLFYVILIATAFFFVLTEVLLVYAMWRFSHSPSRRASHVEGNMRLEMLWTVIPGAILVYIALAQIGAWARVKYQTNMPAPDQVVQITARQWEWRFRYPEEENIAPADPRGWAESPALSDVHGVNEVHTWKGAKVRVFLKTRDVLHSFFVPHFRLKQDALPGKTVQMWFEPLESNASFDEATGRTVLDEGAEKEWEFACAELCGGRHYQMRGLVYVHKDREDYLKWLRHSAREQRRATPEETPAAAE